MCRQYFFYEIGTETKPRFIERDFIVTECELILNIMIVATGVCAVTFELTIIIIWFQ